MSNEVITLGGGCFWCLDGAFRMIKGVSTVNCGYAGGDTEQPNYKQVCGGGTGHAEVIQLEFDSGIISVSDILEVFFTLHDPTTLNRQGADVGTQYRSVIFYHSDDQRLAAEKVINTLGSNGVWPDPIVTEVLPIDRFYEAEHYHQDYFRRNSEERYCQVVIRPKIDRLLNKHGDKI